MGVRQILEEELIRRSKFYEIKRLTRLDNAWQEKERIVIKIKKSRQKACSRIAENSTEIDNRMVRQK